MADRMREQGVECLWLDATGLADFGSRFPTIAASLMAIGLDPSHDWLPIAPAAHYLSGGVLTDLSGATALPGLWAAGEVACTGVHGANRLASNSLLEGMVFGARLAEAIAAGVDGPSPTGAMGAFLGADWEPLEANSDGPGTATGPVEGAGPVEGMSPIADRPWLDVVKTREELQRTMIAGAGVVRSAESLRTAGHGVRAIAAQVGGVPVDRAHGELANLVTASKSVLTSAAVRTETRGAHARSDFPEAAEGWRRRIVHTADGVVLLDMPRPDPEHHRRSDPDTSDR